MSHVFHERASEPDPPILFDGCERCEELAADPLFLLDDGKLADLWRVMVEVEKGVRDQYRSGNEGTAARKMYEMAVFLERHTDIDPWHWPFKTVTPFSQKPVAMEGQRELL